MKTKTLLIMIAGLLCLTGTPSQAGTYTWTDENGVRHSSDLSPSQYRREQEKEALGDAEFTPADSQKTIEQMKQQLPSYDPAKDPKFYPTNETPDSTPSADTAPPGPSTDTVQKTKQPPSTPPDKVKKTEPPPSIPIDKVKETESPPTAGQPPEKTTPPKKVDPKRIEYYKNQIERMQELIASQEKLIIQDVKNIGLLENRIDALPKTKANQPALDSLDQSLESARRQLKQDEKELNLIKNSLERYRMKLDAARQ